MPRLTAFIATIAIVIAAAVVAPSASAQFNIFGLSNTTPPPAALARQLDKPVPPSLLATLARASHEGLAFTGKATASDMYAIKGPRPNSGSKSGLLYIGADFCPYCAGERWGLMLTVLRFGKLNGVRYTFSSSTDVYPNTPTVTFLHASFTSPYLDFQAIETADREQHPLTQPDALQNKIFTTFDAPPYVQYSESIPFVYVNGQYMLGSLLVTPKDIDGKTWDQIAATLANPKSPLFKRVMPRVNLLTAAICRGNGGQPIDVCTAPGVKAADGVLGTLLPRL